MMGQSLYKLGEQLMKKQIVLDGNRDLAVRQAETSSGEQIFKYFPCPEVDDLKDALQRLAEAREEFDIVSRQWEEVR